MGVEVGHFPLCGLIFPDTDLGRKRPGPALFPTPLDGGPEERGWPVSPPKFVSICFLASLRRRATVSTGSSKLVYPWVSLCNDASPRSRQ